MTRARAFINATYAAGREFLRPAQASCESGAAVSSTIVPIRSVGSGHSARISQHLLQLSPGDRYLRFGYAASDEQILRYVEGLKFERDEVFGIFSRHLELLAVAHLAFSVDPGYASCSEFGVSVASHVRGRGYGARLFDRAVMHARNEGVTMMFIHALSQNTVMLNIARKAGATVERDGSESEAYLRLQPADIDSRLTEFLEENMAQTDYHLKVQAKQFWRFLSILQEVRRGVRDARDRTPM